MSSLSHHCGTIPAVNNLQEKGSIFQYSPWRWEGGDPELNQGIIWRSAIQRPGASARPSVLKVLQFFLRHYHQLRSTVWAHEPRGIFNFQTITLHLDPIHWLMHVIWKMHPSTRGLVIASPASHFLGSIWCLNFILPVFHPQRCNQWCWFLTWYKYC